MEAVRIGLSTSLSNIYVSTLPSPRGIHHLIVPRFQKCNRVVHRLEGLRLPAFNECFTVHLCWFADGVVPIENFDEVAPVDIDVCLQYVRLFTYGFICLSGQDVQEEGEGARFDEHVCPVHVVVRYAVLLHDFKRRQHLQRELYKGVAVSSLYFIQQSRIAAVSHNDAFDAYLVIGGHGSLHSLPREQTAHRQVDRVDKAWRLREDGEWVNKESGFNVRDDTRVHFGFVV